MIVYQHVLCIVILNLVNCREIDKLFRLDIIHFNDFHDRMEETTVLYPVCKSNNSECLGGFSRLYKGIEILLEEKPNALVLDAGDNYQGTYWNTLLKWNVLLKLINTLPIDVHTIGNHEFDDGLEGLVQYLSNLSSPAVVANLDISEEPRLKGLFQSHTIIEKNGRKIGIIGVTVPISNITAEGNIEFLDPVDTVKKEADTLNNEGIDIIIVLSHCGLDTDKKIARESGEHVDLIVGGHSHSLLWNGHAPSDEFVSGPYPVVIEANSKPEHKVLIVTASSYSKYLGNFTMYINAKGEVQSFEGQPLYLNRTIPEDPRIKSFLRPYADDLHSKVNEVIGFTNNDVKDSDCPSRECEIGDLVADAFLDAANNLNNSTLPHVGFIFRVVARAPFLRGEITRADAINTLPLKYKVVTFVAPGRFLWDAFEESLKFSWTKKPFKAPYMPQVSGMQVTLNTTSAKVVSILITQTDGFKPLLASILDEDYQITAPDFVIKAKGFKNLMSTVRDVQFVGYDYEILEKYIKKISPFTVTLNNRLIVLK